MTPFALCFEAHKADGLIWALKWPLGDIDDDRDWTYHTGVSLTVPLYTVYRIGPQPRAYLTGKAMHRSALVSHVDIW